MLTPRPELLAVTRACEHLLSTDMQLTEEERNLLEFYVNDMVREFLSVRSIVSNPPQTWVLSFASHGIHDVSGENSLFWRVTEGRCGLAFHPLTLDTNALCIASHNSTTAFFLSRSPRFFAVS